jgi:two-component system, NtrC family, sensor histidine kinase HydH
MEGAVRRPVESARGGDLLRNPWTRRAVLLVIVIAVAALENLTPPEHTHWHYIFPRLFYLPIGFAALYDGWRGGLVFALLSSLAFVPQFIGESDFSSDRIINRYIELVSFCGAAILIGVYTDRERQQKKQYQDLAEKLASVYGELQSNFESMKRAERLSAIGQLSAGLAHEIRNPLASIAGAASILRRSQASDPKAAKCIDIIDSECKRLNGLLTNFLNFARPRPPHFQSVEIVSVLDDVIALAHHATGKKRIEFRKQVDEGLPPLYCDPEQLRQVLLNLLINAIEASDEGCAVTLTGERSDGSFMIRVIDEGSGMAPEHIDRLFDPFFTTKESGTGLGLSVAHQIVGQMGGLLSARRNNGPGMTFSISLPLKERSAA